MSLHMIDDESSQLEMQKYCDLIESHFKAKKLSDLNQLASVLVSTLSTSNLKGDPPNVTIAKLLNLISSHSYATPDCIQSLSNFLTQNETF